MVYGDTAFHLITITKSLQDMAKAVSALSRRLDRLEMLKDPRPQPMGQIQKNDPYMLE